jgi:hypothetical protein
MRRVFGSSWSGPAWYTPFPERGRIMPDGRSNALGLRLARSPVQRMQR